MRKFIVILLVIGLATALSACVGRIDNWDAAQTGAPDSDDAKYGSRLNMVYESVELISLIMRLSGDIWVYSDELTQYQQSLFPAFGEFADHPAAEYARHLRQSRGIGFDAPMWLALYMERAGDGFRLMEGAAFWYEDERWTPEIVDEFIPLINDFYAESNFGEFFASNTAYFEELSQRMADELLSKINYDWFHQFGFSPEELRVSIYPSSSGGAFGPTIWGINYAVLPVTGYYGDFLELVIHEFAHSFANPTADAWYGENGEFRRMSDDSLDLLRLHYYGTGQIMAREYVTRAYTILYMAENHDADIMFLLLDEIAAGFPYIEAVYSMITDHDLIFTPETDMLALIFGEGLEYSLGENRQAVIEADRLRFQTVDLMGAELDLSGFEHNNNGNFIDSREGDVLILFDNDAEYLLIDLGENPDGVEWGLPEGELRKYSGFHLDDEDEIAQILGVEYTRGETQYITFREEQVFQYQFMELLNRELQLDGFKHNDNESIYSTQTGDIILVARDGKRYLYIDLGPNGELIEAWGLPPETMRKYSVFPLDI
ncbi:MAG: DUF4932 domain-containing protein [Defluviitaleaceae bacterium]|nr:DUF4932 domain-containing protein [Defluviitaleaceae bacterium]MCL2837140.1 DUF4932 domain-containing protein [Defluviitaleaceae bacterium]